MLLARWPARSASATNVRQRQATRPAATSLAAPRQKTGDVERRYVQGGQLVGIVSRADLVAHSRSTGDRGRDPRGLCAPGGDVVRSRSGGSPAWSSTASGRRLSRPVRTPAAAVALARDDRDRREGRSRCPPRRAVATRLHGDRTHRAVAVDRLRRGAQRRRPAGRLGRRAGGRHVPPQAPATTRCSPTPSGTTRSSASCSRPSCACGARGAREDGTLEVGERRARRRATPSSACARATCMRWRSRTACSSATATSTPTTRRAGATRSSSRSTAVAPGGTCFCTSMDTGPRVTAGFDLALTELLDERGHRFVVEVGQRARRRGPRASRASRGRRRRAARARRRRRAGARVDGPHARRHGHPGPAAGATPSTRAGTRSPTAA